jgi:hypothetical protein
MIQLANQIFELNRLIHSIQKYSRLKMNRARARGYEFSLIFDFFQIEDVPVYSVEAQPIRKDIILG